ncbi:MAG: hypothetical protein VKP62_00025 [Candidatus Sericytochromatia bacterium]|nr:hypothetical protein [Candidatus Sericytochromatia bacterium]
MLKIDKDSSWIFAAAILFPAVIYFFYTPTWETNDDIAMMSIAHGFGLVAESSPNILLSNVLIGYLVCIIPEMFGILGYSIFSVFSIFLALFFSVYSLRVMQVRWAFLVIGLIFVFLRPFLFIQFTATAGLLTAAAVLSWIAWGRTEKKILLIGGWCLAFLGLLVRPREFVLVLFVAAPMLPWRMLFTDIVARRCGLVFVTSAAFAFWLDARAYSAAPWQDIVSMGGNLGQILLWIADERLMRQPDVMSQFQYSINDLRLLKSWFFVDRSLVDPVRLGGALKDVGPLSDGVYTFGYLGYTGVRAVLDSHVFPLVIPVGVFLFLRPNRRYALACLLCLFAFFLLGAWGRPAPVRVAFAPLALLLLTTLTFPRPRFHPVYYAVLCATALAHGAHIAQASRDYQALLSQIRGQLCSFPREVVTIWADSLPSEAIYPVFKVPHEVRQLKFYTLGEQAYMPFSNSYPLEKSGRGFLTRLRSPEGVLLVARNEYVELLRGYCQEHWGLELREMASQECGVFKIRRMRCAVSD